MSFEPDKAPLVSVLIPAYNHRAYVISCLESLLVDGYPKLEVVFLDDGSSDQTFETASVWLHEHDGMFERLSVKQQENVGLCATLNRLVDNSTGDYVVILASDDYLLRGGIAARLQALDANPTWLAVFGDCIVVNEHSQTIHRSGISDLYKGDKVALVNPKRIRTELLWNWCVPGPVLMARRICFDKKYGIGKYDESLLVEDRDFYLRLLSRNAIGYINETVSAYRVHMHNSFSVPSLKRRLALAQSMVSTLEKHIDRFHRLERFALILELWRYSASARAMVAAENLFFRIIFVIARNVKPIVYQLLKIFCRGWFSVPAKD